MTVELDPRITEELKRLYKSLEEQGNLLTREQLAEYYNTFRNRFGPDKLRNLDGEALLNMLHDMQNKDSLVYWIEFKNDEEFPSPMFGSISGGSSFKFGLFRKKETGIWMTGSSKKQEPLSIEQAIAIARQHRDQLLYGVRLLEEIPENGSDEDYQHLQQEMEVAGSGVLLVPTMHRSLPTGGFCSSTVLLFRISPSKEGRFTGSTRKTSQPPSPFLCPSSSKNINNVSSV
jgi:hypothetical protein